MDVEVMLAESIDNAERDLYLVEDKGRLVAFFRIASAAGSRRATTTVYVAEPGAFVGVRSGRLEVTLQKQ